MRGIDELMLGSLFECNSPACVLYTMYESVSESIPIYEDDTNIKYLSKGKILYGFKDKLMGTINYLIDNKISDEFSRLKDSSNYMVILKDKVDKEYITLFREF